MFFSSKNFDAKKMKKEFARCGYDDYTLEAYDKIIELFDGATFELKTPVIGEIFEGFTEYTPDQLIEDFEYFLTMPIEDTITERKKRYFETYGIKNPTQEEEEEAEYYSKMNIINHILNQLGGDYTIEELTNGNFLIF